MSTGSCGGAGAGCCCAARVRAAFRTGFSLDRLLRRRWRRLRLRGSGAGGLRGPGSLLDRLGLARVADVIEDEPERQPFPAAAAAASPAQMAGRGSKPATTTWTLKLQQRLAGPKGVESIHSAAERRRLDRSRAFWTGPARSGEVADRNHQELSAGRAGEAKAQFRRWSRRIGSHGMISSTRPWNTGFSEPQNTRKLLERQRNGVG